VQDNLTAVSTRKERKFRQYMNRRGGFNRQATHPHCLVRLTPLLARPQANLSLFPPRRPLDKMA